MVRMADKRNRNAAYEAMAIPSFANKASIQFNVAYFDF